MNDRPQAFALARTSEPVPCAKCQAQVRRKERQGINTATHVLTQGAYRWPLCTNHAAAASWAHGIPCAMNPEGKTALTTANKPKD